MTELGPALREAREALDSDEPLEAFRAIRFFLASPELAQEAGWGDAWRMFAEIADEVVGPELGSSARRLAESDDDPDVLYDFGYQAIEVGLPDLAAGVLHRLNDMEPGVEQYLSEYVVALESLGRNDIAVDALAAQAELLESSFMCRYLLAFNAVMSGAPLVAQNVTLAPSGEEEEAMAARIERFLARVEGLTDLAPLADHDLRSWQFVTTGSLLLHLSPHGFDEGMNGRYAFVQDSYAICRQGLTRLKAVLDTWDIAPPRLLWVDERGSQVLCQAASQLWDLPAEPFSVEEPRRQGLVLAYDLALVDGPTLYALHEKRPNQLLFSHAACWVSPPAFTPDFHTFQYQSNVAPWGERMEYDPESEEMTTTEADSATVEELAERIVSASHDADAHRPTEDLVSFARAVAQFPEDAAPTALVDHATRSRFWDSSPVKSGKFA